MMNSTDSTQVNVLKLQASEQASNATQSATKLTKLRSLAGHKVARTLTRCFLALLCVAAALLLALAMFPTALQGFALDHGVENTSKQIGAYLNGAPLTVSGSPFVADQGDPARSVRVDNSTEHRQLATFISKKYNVASSQVAHFIKLAHKWGADLKVDPLLILGVMSIESNFNPIVESNMGAQGLMQVLTRVHLDKLQIYGGESKAFEPEANIAVGSKILADCLKLGGSTEAGLKCYVGATGPTDGGYGLKVLAERDRLAKAMTGQFDFTPNNKVLLDMASSAVSAPINLELPQSMATIPNVNNNQSATTSTITNSWANANSSISPNTPLGTSTPTQILDTDKHSKVDKHE